MSFRAWLRATAARRWPTDLGAALDFTVLPLVDLGVQLSYNAVAAGSGQPAFEWMQAAPT
jgi:hypothetical protein